MSDRRFFGYAICLPFVGLLLTGCLSNPTSQEQEIAFKAALTGTQESLAATSAVHGVAAGSGAPIGRGTFTLNAAQTQLTFDISISGLSGPVTAAHFHSGLVGTTGPAVFDISGTVVQVGAYGQITAKGTWTLNEADLINMMAGHIYVDFHTAKHADGEVRGQLIQQ